ncbi:NACHT domain-containing protein [Leptothermofonsia sichuanensis E412]|uniref:NACHT domain-containing protein n=1 Tax=Leptothermofonsia sichuanensis TaxID=2917832 RepID=UPI001CA607C0|nr:NACHT domain-containing protein [Leptothermofonsia sichuanensis]QZZ20761.1 NACHT domain-containing protein [Leptothermofonsia sichuanensis E412]
MLLERVFIQAATLTLASIFSRVVCDGGGKFVSWVKERDEDPRQLLDRAAEQYAQRYANRHGILKVLGMREPVSLESVYTSVQFLDGDSINPYDSIEELEKAFRERPEPSFQLRNSKKQDGLKVANKQPYLMVLGGPGAGKSTFLRKMGLEALKGRSGGYLHESIPVLIELKSFNTEKIDIAAAIAQEFRICGFPSSEQTTLKLLEQGMLLLLLDGLDEVPSRNLDTAIHQIQDFVDQYDRNRFITSCRIAAYHHNFKRFTDVAMADFSHTQIKQFIFNWFHSEIDLQANTAQRCWQLLQKPENRTARELAQTPLLLTLLCLVYDKKQQFPQNRSVLYSRALRVLMEEWAAEKRIFQEEIYQGLSTELEEVLLSEIAYQGFEANRLFFQKKEVVNQIKYFLADNLNAPRHLDGESILEAIAIQQGILVERAQDVYSFSHLTLQEYLTAQYIDDHQIIRKLVTEHLTHERWQEVFLLVAGLMKGGADSLLLAMEAQAKTFITTPKLQALLNWATGVTSDSDSNLTPATRRSTALFLALVNDATFNLVHLLHPDLAQTLKLAGTLANTRIAGFTTNLDKTPARAAIPTRALAIALTHSRATRPVGQVFNQALVETFIKKLTTFQIFKESNFQVLVSRLQALKEEAPDIRQPASVHQEFYHRVYQIWFNTLKLDPAWINLSTEELRKLECYFYANWLMIRCRQAAVRVSSQTWTGIEARILQG